MSTQVSNAVNTYSAPESIVRRIYEQVARLDRVGMSLLRLGLIIVLCWIGGLKFADYEADGIVPLVANSPLMSFFYHYPGDPAPGIGTGLSDLDSGLRLGYQFLRHVPPSI